LGQELTARSNYTGIIRKRLFPCIFVDTSTQLPIPFWTTSARQEQQQLSTPIPFPRLGISDAAAIISLFQGIPIRGADDLKDEKDSISKDQSIDELKRQEITEQDKERTPSLAEGERSGLTNPKVMETLNELDTHGKVGSKIINRMDGRTVGEIVSSAVPGTSVLIAQMRLEWLGMLKTSTHGESDQDTSMNTLHHPWKLTNKVVIGGSKKELRCLPYIPLWWPNMNMSTGKAEEEEKK
jgi:hypothetical protein